MSVSISGVLKLKVLIPSQVRSFELVEETGSRRRQQHCRWVAMTRSHQLRGTKLQSKQTHRLVAHVMYKALKHELDSFEGPIRVLN